MNFHICPSRFLPSAKPHGQQVAFWVVRREEGGGRRRRKEREEEEDDLLTHSR